MRTLTSVEAQNRFSELLDTARREPVTITRRGRPVAFLLSAQEFHALRDAAQGAGQAQRRQDGDAAIRAFAGSGRGGSTARLLEDRAADRRRVG